MENELQVLNNIEKNINATQRDIARSTGMSLGSVNILIKRLVKKGLLKMERLNPRIIRYILTPQGMKEKAEATYDYVVASYRFINGINSRLDGLIAAHGLQNNGKVMLFGSRDEICAIITNKFNERSIGYDLITSVEKLTSGNSQYAALLVWHPDFIDKMSQTGIEYINVLEKI